MSRTNATARPGRGSWAVATAAICAVATAACGASTTPTTAAAVSTHYARALEFSKCMRSHGVPNFPDPSGGGGIHLELGSGVNPLSPAFKTARVACAELLLDGGFGNQQPTAQQIDAARRTSQCMRQHGVSGFPDPALKPPSSPAGYSILENRGGVIVAVPSTIDPSSPVFVLAAKACQFS